MKCELCNNTKSKRYIAFPEREHLTENIQVLYLCKKCKPVWFKAIPQDLRLEFRHWILRSTIFKPKLERLSLTSDQETIIEIGAENEIDFPIYKTLGYIPDEEDLLI